MANLLNTTVNGTLTSSTSIQSPKLLHTNSSQVFKEITGTVFIPSAAGNPYVVNYVDLFANTGVYERMYGTVHFWVNQSQFHAGAFRFQLSEYGLNTQILMDTSGYFSLSRFSPTFGTNYIRFTNTVNTSWGDGTYYFNVRWTGLGGASFFSSYLTERVR
jgi:hypothetical protein